MVCVILFDHDEMFLTYLLMGPPPPSFIIEVSTFLQIDKHTESAPEQIYWRGVGHQRGGTAV